MYEAKVILDSMHRGHRITTMQWTFPRFILAEVNTHRMFSRNSASSRAIPVARRIEQIEAEPFIPEAFGKNKAGMQSAETLEERENELARLVWLGASQIAIEHAKKLVEFGVHKQWANRVIETYAWHTAVITSTEWSNHDGLRCHPAASPEYQKIAMMARDARTASVPIQADSDYWHLPYVLGPDRKILDPADLMEAERLVQVMGQKVTLESLARVFRKVSVGRCAAVSYERQELKDFTKDVERYNKLRSSGHMSPFEHIARPMNDYEYNDLFRQKTLTWNETRWHWEWGGTYTSFCGNVQGWVQDRKMIPNEHDFSKVGPLS